MTDNVYAKEEANRAQ